MTTAIIITLILAVILIASFIDHLPKKYRRRGCQGIYWRRRYPAVSKDEIRKYLRVFCEAFSFKEKHRSRFRPDDKVIDVYRAIYPSRFTADAMELEEFAEALEKEYGLDIANVFNDNTSLGDLFESAMEKSAL